MATSDESTYLETATCTSIMKRGVKTYITCSVIPRWSPPAAARNAAVGLTRRNNGAAGHMTLLRAHTRPERAGDHTLTPVRVADHRRELDAPRVPI